MKKILLKGSFKDKIMTIIFLIISILIVLFVFKQANMTRKIMKVPVLNKDLTIGHKIDEKDINIKEIGVFNNNDIIKDKKSIIGKYVKCNLKKDRYIYLEDIQEEKIPISIHEKIQYGAIAISTNIIKCVGGIPKAGDYVKVSIVKKSQENEDVNVSQPEQLKKIKILQIQDDSSIEVKREEGKDKELSPSQIIFDVTKEQEEMLLKAEYLGNIHLTLLPLKEQNREE